jgi:hypothetical protein
MLLLVVLAGCTPVKKAGVPSAALLRQKAVQAGVYMVRAQHPDGKFDYLYDSKRDVVPSKEYNVVRHAAAGYALYRLYEETGDEQYRKAGSRALDYLTRYYRWHGDAMYVREEDGTTRLGANGVALLALSYRLQYGAKKKDEYHARKLVELLLEMQGEDGIFNTYYRLKGDEPQGSTVLFFPGEAMLALMAYYDYAQDERVLAAVERGADALILSQQKMKPLPLDAWFMQALEKLHQVKPKEAYVEHAAALAKQMQKDRNHYRNSVTTVARTEGEVAAWRMAQGRWAAAAMEEHIVASVVFANKFQYGQFPLQRAKNPEKAAGGLLYRRRDPVIRIDYPQHYICALLGAADMLESRYGY